MLHFIRGCALSLDDLSDDSQTVIFRDTLIQGECSASHDVHQRIRIALTRGNDDSGVLKSAIRNYFGDITIWVSEDWADSIFTWWACSLLEHAQFRRNVLLAKIDKNLRVDTATTEEARAAFRSSLELNQYFDQLAQCWSCFASDRPNELIDKVAANRIVTPSQFSSHYALFFPRISRKQFLLSRFDEQLLRLFRVHKWTRMIDINHVVRTQFSFVPPNLILERISAFAQSEPGLLAQRESVNSAVWDRSYKLSREGVAAINGTSGSMISMPTMVIGGSRLYSENSWFLSDSVIDEDVNENNSVCRFVKANEK